MCISGSTSTVRRYIEFPKITLGKVKKSTCFAANNNLLGYTPRVVARIF
jgi:hypothetical protein